MMNYPYKLNISNDMVIGQNIIFIDKINSTNDEAKRLALKGEKNGTVIFAYDQTQGRGRLGKVWIAEPGKNINMSIILKPDKPLKSEYASSITLVMGLACVKAIQNITKNDEVLIKWPNDILLNGRKICGILTESSISDNIVEHIIVGVGVNVSNKFEGVSDDVNRKATSLFKELGRKFDMAYVANALIEEIDIQYKAFLNGDLNDILYEYKNNCINIHTHVRATAYGKVIEGVASDITKEGNLVINIASGEKVVVCSGDTSVRGIDGFYF